MLLVPDDRLARSTARRPSAPAGSWRCWRSRPRCRSRGPAAARGPGCRTRRAAGGRTPRRRRSRWPAAGPWPAASCAVGWAFSGWRATSSAWWCVVPWNDDKPGGDGVVRARLDLHVVGRVGVDQVDGGAVEQAVHVLGLAAVAAQQAVLAEEPQVAGLRDRLVGRLGHVVGIGLALVRSPSPAAAAVRRRRSRSGSRSKSISCSCGQLQRQLVVVPAGQRRPSGCRRCGTPWPGPASGRRRRGPAPLPGRASAPPCSACGRR